jgi:hypothetical protein
MNPRKIKIKLALLTIQLKIWKIVCKVMHRRRLIIHPNSSLNLKLIQGGEKHGHPHPCGTGEDEIKSRRSSLK